MQSIDDEIPDLSGPVSLGMYKFTRRGRGKKYETHRLSELQNVGEKENKESEKTEKTVTTVAAPTLSAPSITTTTITSTTPFTTHPPFDLIPPTTLTFSSSQSSEQPPNHHQTKTTLRDKVNNNILNRSDNPSSNGRDFHEPSRRQTHEPGLIHSAADYPELINSSHSNERKAQPSFPATQDYPSWQDSIKPSSKAAFEQVNSEILRESHRSHLNFTSTINPERPSSHSESAQANNSARPTDHTSDQIFNLWTDSDRQGSQASRQTHPSLPPTDHHLNSSQKYNQFAKSLNAFLKPSGRSSKVSTQTTSRLPAQDFQRLISKLYRKRVSKTDDLPETHREISGASNQLHHSAAPKEYASPQSLPLSDTLPTASFNLETNQWDPDLSEATMSAQTPTDKSILGGHSGQQSSEKSSSQGSYASQDGRNPYAVVTTTKAGRPYTNPYMPIYPPPSTTRQTVKVSPSDNPNHLSQTEAAELIERQRKTRYVDQEKARAQQGHVRESLDDPFQDQSTYTQQHYGRIQPSNYAESAAGQAAYGQFPSSHYQPTSTTYATIPHVSSFISNEQKPQHAPDTGVSPYRNQLSAYDPQSGVNSRSQIPGMATHEQRPGYEQANPRASVRLPAVKGTTEQQKHNLREANIGSLSLEDSIKNAQDPLRRQTQGGIQPAASRASHAIPIRDPAAYTGSGLTSRRNQDALRQNLETVVASSQGSTGAARTVMNDPHRDRQPSSRPSSTATESTVTGSTLRAQAPSYEFVNLQRPETIDQPVVKPRQGTTQRQGKAPLEGMDSRLLHAHTGYSSKSFERGTPDPEFMYHPDNYRSPAVPPGLGYDADAITKNAGLPNKAIGAGNAFMNELKAQTLLKKTPEQRLEDSMNWFRHDPRDLSYAAAILPYETMNMMNQERFPLEDRTPLSISQLADESQDDGPIDRTRETATPRPIGHGRPAGFATPPSGPGPRRVASQTPFSTLAGVASAKDKEAMERSGREFLRNDQRAIEAMFGGVYENLMSGKNGPYDYMNHYCPPPAYAIDHNPRNDHTLFDPQWFATAPPARVGRDPRREQGEYEDPTQGIPGRARGEAIRRDSGGRGGGGVRGWGRN